MSSKPADERDVQRQLSSVRRVELNEPMPHQIPIICERYRFKDVLCGRRSGKSIGVGRNVAILGHGLLPDGSMLYKGCLFGGNVWYGMPTMPQMRETWDEFEYILRDVWVRRNVTERFFDLPGGGRLQLKSADQPERWRGPGLTIAILDEQKDIHPSIYKALRPTLADKLGSLVCMGTPGNPIATQGNVWGDLSYDIYLKAKSRKGWKLYQLPTSSNPMITPEELEEMRVELGPLGFQRECMAQFVSDHGCLFKGEWFKRFKRNGMQVVLPGGRTYDWGHLYRFATVDLAASTGSKSDWSVVASWAVTPENDLLLLEVRRGRWDGSQILEEMTNARDLFGLQGIWIEQAASSAHIIDIAGRTLPVRELHADKSKELRALPATAVAQQGKIHLLETTDPWLQDFLDEVLTFTPGEKKGKDDQVDVLSYAVRVMSSARNKIGPNVQSGYKRREGNERWTIGRSLHPSEMR